MTGSSFWDERIETLPRDVLQQVQLGRLEWQIRRCWDSSEFYRERLQQAGLEPDAIQSLEDLRRVPLLTFEQLAEERRRHPPFGRSAIASGTTWRELQLVAQGPGDSIVVIASEADLENGAGLVARALWSMGVRTNDVVQNALPSGESTLARLVQGAADRIGCLIVSTGAAGPDRQVESLRRLAPSTLLATPT